MLCAQLVLKEPLKGARTAKMTMSVPEKLSGSGGKEEESEDESEILEESPCGRWQKRREQVTPSRRATYASFAFLVWATHVF